MVTDGWVGKLKVSGGIRALLVAQMRRSGWNQADLAAALAVEPSVVNRWLSVKQPRRPSTEHCARIATVLELPLTRIMELAGHLPTGTPAELADSEWDQFQAGLRALFGQVPRDRWWPILDGLGALVRATSDGGAGTKASIVCSDKSVRHAYLRPSAHHALA